MTNYEEGRQGGRVEEWEGRSEGMRSYVEGREGGRVEEGKVGVT